MQLSKRFEDCLADQYHSSQSSSQVFMLISKELRHFFLLKKHKFEKKIITDDMQGVSFSFFSNFQFGGQKIRHGPKFRDSIWIVRWALNFAALKLMDQT